MEELIIASSSVDGGIASWNLRSGAEQLRYRTCASPPHGLLFVSGRFLASSQLRDSPNSASASAPIFFWSPEKPQVAVKSFPAEPIGPLVSNSTYIIGGGKSGSIYLWELETGKLLNKWSAHYRSVTCLALPDDESTLVSASEDGSVKIWNLMMCCCRMFDDVTYERDPCRYSLLEHALCVTDVAVGHGLCNPIIVSSSEDRTCKVWSLSEGKLLRSISFPSIIDGIAIDPGEHAFYAGARDGKIYIAALNADWDRNSSYGMFIIGSLADHSKAVTCLIFSLDGVTLVSGSDDGTVRVWDTKNKHATRALKHGKGPVNNVLLVRQPPRASSQELTDSLKRKCAHLPLPPPLDKYISSTDEEIDSKGVTVHRPPLHDPEIGTCRSSYMMNSQIKELQNRGSSGAMEIELERLQEECKRYAEMLHQQKKLYQDLQNVCVNELLSESQLAED